MMFVVSCKVTSGVSFQFFHLSPAGCETNKERILAVKLSTQTFASQQIAGLNEKLNMSKINLEIRIFIEEFDWF